jgi:transposase
MAFTDGFLSHEEASRMSTRRGRDPEREQFWRGTVAAWEKSGQSVRDFCAARGLREPNFYYWKRALARQSPPRPSLVPVRVIPEPVLEVVLPTGLVVRVPAGAEPTTVAQLVAALGAPAC